MPCPMPWLYRVRLSCVCVRSTTQYRTEGQYGRAVRYHSPHSRRDRGHVCHVAFRILSGFLAPLLRIRSIDRSHVRRDRLRFVRTMVRPRFRLACGWGCGLGGCVNTRRTHSCVHIMILNHMLNCSCHTHALPHTDHRLWREWEREHLNKTLQTRRRPRRASFGSMRIPAVMSMSCTTGVTRMVRAWAGSARRDSHGDSASPDLTHEDEVSGES
jgi:hypothetical protein